MKIMRMNSSGWYVYSTIHSESGTTSVNLYGDVPKTLRVSSAVPGGGGP